MKLSILIPVFNESPTLIQVINKIKMVPLPSELDREIVLIDDGSTDGSSTLLDKFRGLPDMRILTFGLNRGKGAAIQAGLKDATGDLLIIQDADLEYDPMDYLKIIAPLLSRESDVVYG